MKTDVVVLGAGIIGVSAALHLQARGRSVVLLDRRGAGEETSHGNAGLIERSSVIPYAFPRKLSKILRYSLNTSLDARYHVRHLPAALPWLFQYWRHSSPRRLAEAAAAMLPLIERSLIEHEPLMREAGTEFRLRRSGWLAAHRSEATFRAAIADAQALAPYALSHDVLDGRKLRDLEPHLSERLVGAIHWHDPASVSDPGAVTKAYGDLFVRRGGRFINGDARSLAASGGAWTATTAEGILTAGEAVVALGPWSTDVFTQFGYRIPLGIKRGYHMHYSASANAVLRRPVLDADSGFLLTPMTRGIRLTTGVEFGAREAPPSPVQLDRAEPLARTIFPLDARVDAAPWLGRRPALPDMRPVIGPAPRHRGLWFAFGHAHHGFTLGPVTGRLLAEMITGQTPVVDPAPYSPARFG
ncbi:MAG TPA: FAD-dependent oxidoreductase [Stellaceae bacterium]|nr:FAD-dependent oxidoreductase [Stellaceae bacterium]